MPEDPCSEARSRVQQWEMKVEALEKKRDRAAMGKVIKPGALSKLGADIAEAERHLASARDELEECEAAGQLRVS